MDLKTQAQYRQEIYNCWNMNDAQKAEIERLKKEQLRLAYEVGRLRAAIQKTLDENGHLADGENCTLIHLVRVIETPNVERNRPAAGLPGDGPVDGRVGPRTKGDKE